MTLHTTSRFVLGCTQEFRIAPPYDFSQPRHICAAVVGPRFALREQEGTAVDRR